MIDMQPFQKDNERLAEIKRAIKEADLELARMYHEYDMMSDGRMEMMEAIKGLRATLDTLLDDLHAHVEHSLYALNLLNEVAYQRTEAIADRDRLKLQLVVKQMRNALIGDDE